LNTAREPKPSWSEVPAALREKIAGLVGEPIAKGEIVYGGFGPTATFALTTTSGAKHFVKGTHPGNTKEGHIAVLRECRGLTNYPELAAFGPRYLGMAEEDGWTLAVLEFAARGKAVPPWSAADAQRAIEHVAAFHGATPARVATELRDIMSSDLLAKGSNWHSLNDARVRGSFVQLFAEPDSAERWLRAHLNTLIGLKAQVPGGPRSWVHMDIRSDNFVFADDGRLLLVDWPVLSYGPRLLDIAFFLPSLEGEGGPACADGLSRYAAAAGLTFAAADLAIATATVAGFFAARAGEPEIAALPRLRWIQKLQLFPALGWMCDQLGIEHPPAPRQA
jgi:aminoglycoside phosphotransferase (APT) family kinase protein